MTKLYSKRLSEIKLAGEIEAVSRYIGKMVWELKIEAEGIQKNNDDNRFQHLSAINSYVDEIRYAEEELRDLRKLQAGKID